MLALNFKHNFNPVRKVILFPIFLTKCLFFVFFFFTLALFTMKREEGKGGEGRGREKGEEVSRKEGCREEGLRGDLSFSFGNFRL